MDRYACCNSWLLVGMEVFNSLESFDRSSVFFERERPGMSSKVRLPQQE